eukprot:gene3176-3646_t
MLACNIGYLTLACGVGKSSYTKKNYPPFAKYQQKPEEDEESAVASGAFNHKIKYGTTEFKSKLVRFIGTNVIFQDNEGTGADRYMTRRCKKALQRLAQHVSVKWNNKVKVRVIEAWDEDGEHYSRSLHYEGRAIDITTSDRDRDKYGDLASLAYFKAEFDFVTYLDGHVHVSCKRDDAVDDHNSCFPSRATVITENGQQKRMDNLAVGENVLAMTSSGALVYSPVIMFLDARPHTLIRNYVSIKTFEPTERRIELTKKHLVFASQDGVKFQTVFAERVQPGDYIKVLTSNNSALVVAQVNEVAVESYEGAFAPLTEHGTVIVNSAAASCYALTEEHDIAHWSFLPWRYIYNVYKHFGIATTTTTATNPQIGVHWYAKWLRTINSYLGVLPDII